MDDLNRISIRNWKPWRLTLGPFSRTRRRLSWEGVKTCYSSVPRALLWIVKGFDEAYEGWGFEDSNIVVRLLRVEGVIIKDARFGGSVGHLNLEKTNRNLLSDNRCRFDLLKNDTTGGPSRSILQ